MTAIFERKVFLLLGGRAELRDGQMQIVVERVSEKTGGDALRFVQT